MRASPVPRFVLEATAHAHGSPERQQVVRLAVINIVRYRLLDGNIAAYRRHFHTPDHQVLVNEPEHSSAATAVTARFTVAATVAVSNATRRVASVTRERSRGTTCCGMTRSVDVTLTLGRLRRPSVRFGCQ